MVPMFKFTYNSGTTDCTASPEATRQVQSTVGNTAKVITQSIPAFQRMTPSASSANTFGSSAHPSCSESQCDQDSDWPELNECIEVLNGIEADNTDNDEDAPTRGIIGHIINSYPRKGNHLQPSWTQHQLLTELVDSGRVFDPRDMTNLEWLEVIGTGSILFDIVSPEAIADIVTRAKAIVNALDYFDETHVTLLDGHGRVVYQILAELHARGLNVNDYTFTLYDLDADVDAWHKIFMPKSVKSICDDMLCSGRDRLRSPDQLAGVVYLNFCGIGNCVHQTEDMIRALVSKQSRPVLVSYSTRGMSTERETPFSYFYRMTLAMQARPRNGISSQFISEHGAGANYFCTYGFYRADELSPFDYDPDYKPPEEGCMMDSDEMVCEE